MTQYVIDASIAIKWFIPEVYSPDADRLHYSESLMHIPALCLLEIGNVLCKKIRRDELTPQQGMFIFQEFQHLPLIKHTDEHLLPTAYALAIQTHCSLYDCLYLALAETIKGHLVTADKKFLSSLPKGPIRQAVLWIQDIP